MNIKLECQSVVIRQFLKLQLQKCLKCPSEQQIVRLPLLLYQYSRQIFKRETLVIQYLLELLEQVCYLLNIHQQKQDQLAVLYRKVHLQLNDHVSANPNQKTFYLSQIVLRCVILGLSIKINQTQKKMFRKRFKQMMRKLQLELVIGTGGILSEVIIKELTVLRTEFEGLEYYEELKGMFQKCDNEKVETWIEDALEQLRNRSQANRQSILPFQAEGNKMEVQQCKKGSIDDQENKKQTQVKVQEQNHQKNKGKTQCKGERDVKSKTVGKERRVMPKDEMKVSCIKLANKIRQSLPGPSTRFSSKYIFKSTKKNLSQDVVFQANDETRSNVSIQQQCTYYPTCKNLEQKDQNKEFHEDSSKFLCAATPPRRNARKEWR